MPKFIAIFLVLTVSIAFLPDSTVYDHGWWAVEPLNPNHDVILNSRGGVNIKDDDYIVLERLGFGLVKADTADAIVVTSILTITTMFYYYDAYFAALVGYLDEYHK